MKQAFVCFMLSIFLSAFDHGVEPASYQISILTINQFIETQSATTIEESIKLSKADIVAVQESTVLGVKKIAERLQYYSCHFPKSSANVYPYDTGLLSRFPIIAVHDHYAIIEVPGHERIAVFNVHLNPIPFELDWIKKNKNNIHKACQSSRKHRLPRIIEILAEMKHLSSLGIPSFIIGDFNEPSHLDWGNKNNPSQAEDVEWPVSSVLFHAGFTDAYRSCHTDQRHFPGFTWPAKNVHPSEQDRIDFIYHQQDVFEVNDSYTIGGDAAHSDVRFSEYNSDHRAVFAMLERL